MTARPLPDQNEIARRLALSIERHPPDRKSFERISALGEVRDHIRADRRRLLAAACKLQAKRWNALANVVEGKLPMIEYKRAEEAERVMEQHALEDAGELEPASDCLELEANP